ncbi:hypothetical protein ACO0K9_05130 [Undibacterium sp. Ji50W]|uniref:hypothetical protein n=1 Tax=Undibacterium sp. Ji50W TaxID=3413041 RepID=UPI003BF1B791
MVVKRKTRRPAILWGLLAALPLLAQAQLQAWGDYPALPRPLAAARGLSNANNTNNASENADALGFLESLSDAQVRAWMKRQTDFSQTLISRINGRDALLARLRNLQAQDYSAGNLTEVRGRQFFVKPAGDDRPGLFMRNASTAGEKILMLAEAGRSISFFSPSPDGNHVAIGILSTDGRRQHSLRIIKSADASVLKDDLGNIPANAREVSWKADGSALFFPKSAGKADVENGAVWQHVLGTKAREDQALIGAGVGKNRKFSATDAITLKTAANSSFVLAEVRHGNAPDRSLYLVKQDQLKGAATTWQRLGSPTDKIKNAWLSGENLYLVSTKKKAAGAILKLDLKTPQLNTAKELFVANDEEVLELALARNALYAHVAEAGFSKLMKIDLASNKKEEINLPYPGKISQLTADAENEGALFVLEAANAAPLSYRVLPAGEVKNVEVFRSPQIGFHRIATKHLTLTRPGTDKQLSMTLLYPQGMELDGSHACLLSIETGTGLAALAGYDAKRLAWLEQDAVMAIVYVPDSTDVKRRSANDGLDEFLFAADYLVNEGYTSAKKLVVQEMRASQRYLAMAISQRPQLLAAVHSSALLSEPLVTDKNKKTAQRGKNPATGTYPYQQLREASYPAMLLTARFGVGTAPVWMTAKFAARVQMLNADKSRPTLFRTDFANSWKTDAMADQADAWSFFFWQTGRKGFSLRP